MQTVDASIQALGLTLPAGVAPRGDSAPALVRSLMLAAPKWELGATGPLAFHCWSMYQLVQFHLFGRIVEAVRFDTSERGVAPRMVAEHIANAQWSRREGAPQHGDGVKMGHLSNPFHIGVYLDIDRGVVLHHAEHSGLCCDTLTQLRARGFRNVSFHRWVGDSGARNR